VIEKWIAEAKGSADLEDLGTILIHNGIVEVHQKLERW
jgi:hypothetical protein